MTSVHLQRRRRLRLSPPLLPPAPQITTIALDDADEGVPYSMDIETTGVCTSVLMVGDLPDGLTYTDNEDGTGTIAGTPTEDGTFALTFTASGPGGSDEAELNLTVNAPAFDPYSYTSMNANFGFRAGDVTLSGSDITVVANTGDGDLSVRPLNATTRPVWAADPAGNGKPGAVFDGSTDGMFLRDVADTTTRSLDSIINADVGWALTVFKVSAANINTDDATAINNDAIWKCAGDYAGVYARDTAGAGTLYGVNRDAGGHDVVSDAFTFDVTHVATWKHTGGNVSLQVDGGTPVSASSGNTANLTSQVRFFCGIGVFTAGVWQHYMADDVAPVDEADIVTGMGAYYP